MASHELNPVVAMASTARKKLGERQFHPAFNLAAAGFDNWWKKTFAEHAATVAQASSLMRAHRLVSPTGGARIGRLL